MNVSLELLLGLSSHGSERPMHEIVLIMHNKRMTNLSCLSMVQVCVYIYI